MFELEEFLKDDDYENIHRIEFTGVKGITIRYPLLGFEETFPYFFCDFFQMFKTGNDFKAIFPYKTLADLDNLTPTALWGHFYLGDVFIQCMIDFQSVRLVVRYFYEGNQLRADLLDGTKLDITARLGTPSDFMTYTLRWCAMRGIGKRNTKKRLKNNRK